MRRTELLEAAGLTVTTYSALSNRGLLPFEEGKRLAGWTNFEEEDVIRLALVMQLSKAGMGQALAGPLVKANFHRLVRLAEADIRDGPNDGRNPYMFGSATALRKGVEVAQVAVVGALQDLPKELDDAEVAGGSVDALTLVNVSRLMEALLERPTNRVNHELCKWAAFFRAKGTPPYVADRGTR